jgi:hypothetical protein
MSYSPTAELFDIDHARTRRALIPAALAVFVATAGLTIYGANDLREIAIVLSVLALVIAGVYGFLLPRKLTQESAGGTALTLSLIAAVVLLPAFWSGLPLALGAAGAMLGYAGRNATTGSGKCVAALVIGTVTSIGYFSVYVLDALSQAGVSWA